MRKGKAFQKFPDRNMSRTVCPLEGRSWTFESTLKGDNMKSKYSLNLQRATAGLAAVLTMIGFAYAADLPKEGSYDYTTCFTRNSTRIEYSKTHFAYSYEEIGTSVSNPRGALFDDEEVRCVGMTASLDGKRSGGSACLGVAKNGDRRLARFWYDNDGKLKREQVSGSGRYDGMVTTGSVKEVGQAEQVRPGTTKFCNQATGTYKLK
jgi:hypothetical protein